MMQGTLPAPPRRMDIEANDDQRALQLTAGRLAASSVVPGTTFDLPRRTESDRDLDAGIGLDRRPQLLEVPHDPKTISWGNALCDGFLGLDCGRYATAKDDRLDAVRVARMPQRTRVLWSHPIDCRNPLVFAGGSRFLAVRKNFTSELFATRAAGRHQGVQRLLPGRSWPSCPMGDLAGAAEAADSGLVSTAKALDAARSRHRPGHAERAVADRANPR